MYLCSFFPPTVPIPSTLCKYRTNAIAARKAHAAVPRVHTVSGKWGSSDEAHLTDEASKLIVISVCEPRISLSQIKHHICHSESDAERTAFLFINPFRAQFKAWRFSDSQEILHHIQQ